MTSGAPTYMGTKRELAPRIAAEISLSRKGPMLDLFAGMSAVGRAVGKARPLWLNDVQEYACTVNRAVLSSHSRQRFSKAAASDAKRKFDENADNLRELFGNMLEEEVQAFRSDKAEDLRAFSESQVAWALGEGARERAAARSGATTPYRLFSSTHPGGYFSLAQCIELDSARFAVDWLFAEGRITDEVKDHLLAALCRAASMCANTTGHFAQYLGVKPATVRRFLAQRRRSIWDAWLNSAAGLRRVGPPDWRKRNRVYNRDANELLKELLTTGDRPSVIYADPPYTSDQYSRYYHLLETLLIYDYPEPSGKGQYRPGRFVSPFSIRSSVLGAFEKLIKHSAALEATLIISYPTNGLLDENGISLTEMLHRDFKTVHDPIVIKHQHSTMGASKGAERMAVLERVFVAS